MLRNASLTDARDVKARDDEVQCARIWHMSLPSYSLYVGRNASSISFPSTLRETAAFVILQPVDRIFYTRLGASATTGRDFQI